jgi:large subunit ribosomal protein L11
MAKKVTKQLKLVIPGGKANPAPPVGPALGQAGVNIGEFVKQFNDATKDKMGELVPVIISVYEDRSFSFVQKTAPASSLILKAIGVEKGSGTNKLKKAGKLSKAKLREIAEKKLVDLNAHDVEAAMNIIAGSARSMGVDVEK